MNCGGVAGGVGRYEFGLLPACRPSLEPLRHRHGGNHRESRPFRLPRPPPTLARILEKFPVLPLAALLLAFLACTASLRSVVMTPVFREGTAQRLADNSHLVIPNG